MAPISLRLGNTPKFLDRLVTNREATQHASVPGGDQRSTPDADLEHQAFVLMDKLEQLLTQLSNPMQPPSRTQTLAFLSNITNDIVVFAEQLPMDQRFLSLQALVDIAPGNYSQLHSAHISNHRLATSALLAFSADPRIFRGLSNDLLRIINIYLNIFAIAFDTTESKEQWLARFKGFTIDLAIAVHNMQADKFT